MANQEHLDKLKEGVVAWNEWRREHSDIRPNLSRADLNGAHLNGATLTRATLSGADLNGADLNGATLNGADLNGATLHRADLRRADLHRADLTNVHLSEANLSRANLSAANLTGSDLRRANLSAANLRGADLSAARLSAARLSAADLSQAICYETIFADVDLQTTIGLASIRHDGPSSIDIRTLYRSQGNIPEAFLKGTGVDDTFITYIRSLVGTPIDYYSCFISYSSQDQAFAERLFADLQSKNVRCWFAPHHMKIGDKIRPRIDESIRVYEKLLLILSNDSIESTWVAYEVEKALNKEPQGIPNALFPIRIDDTILTCTTYWAQDIKSTRHIGDFTRWKDHDAYQIAFSHLLRDLKAQS